MKDNAIKFGLSCWFCFCLICAPTQADIFQCKGEKGKVEFRDSACTSSDEFVDKINLRPLVTYGSTNGVGNRNLVKNGDFESGVNDWVMPDQAGLVHNVSRLFKTAAYLQALQKNDDLYPQDTSITQCVYLDGSPEYILSADVLVEHISKKRGANRIELIWYASKDCSTGGQWGANVVARPVSGWQKLVSKPVKPTLGSVAVKINIVQKGRYTNNTKTIWDNVLLFGTERNRNIEPTLDRVLTLPSLPVGTNLLKNGRFHRGKVHWSGANARWQSNIGNDALGSLRTELRSDTHGKGSVVARQCVEIARSRFYLLAANVSKSIHSTQAGRGNIRVIWYEGNECRGASRTSPHVARFQDKPGWQAIQTEVLEAPTSARSARVELIQAVRGAGTFVTLWDDIELTIAK